MFVVTLALAASCALGAGPSPVLPAPVSSSLPAGSPELVALYEKGVTYQEFVANARVRKALWEANTAAARVPEDVARRVDALEGRYRLLVVTVPACTDSNWNLPGLARLALYADAVDLRIVSPDEGGQAVMEARLTSDGRPATPTVVVLDEAGEEVGCWIERPARQRDFYLETLKSAQEGTPEYEEAVRDFVGWYREDNGASAQRELLDVLEAAEAGAAGCRLAGG